MPDTKVTSIGIVCLAVIVSAFIYSHRATLFAPTKPKISNAGLVSGTLSFSSTTPDTADWKQALSNINIITPASASADAVADQQSGNDTTTDPNNLTAQVSKNFFSLYMQDQQNGVSIDDNEATNIADESLANVQPSNTQAKQYTAANLHINSAASLSARLAFGKAASSLITKDIPQGGEDPLTIVNNATQGNNSSYDASINSTAEIQGSLSQLNPLITGYQKLINDTLKLSVPSSAVGDTLIYIDSLSDIETDLQNMSKTFTDPVSGYTGFTDYTADIVTLHAIVEQMTIDLNK